MPRLRFFVPDTTKLCKIASHTVLIFHSVAPKGICFAARHLTFLVVTDLTTQPATSGGTPRAFASRHPIFRCTFFTYRSTLPTVSDGPIFRCTTKDGGERRASSSQAPHPSFCLSGQKLSRSAAPPLPTKPTYVGLWRGPLFALLPRTRLYCTMCDKNVGTERITNLIYSRKLGGCESAINSPAARRAHGSSAEHAMRDLIASNAPLRNGSHKARPVYCQH